MTTAVEGILEIYYNDRQDGSLSLPGHSEYALPLGGQNYTTGL